MDIVKLDSVGLKYLKLVMLTSGSGVEYNTHSLNGFPPSAAKRKISGQPPLVGMLPLIYMVEVVFGAMMPPHIEGHGPKRLIPQPPPSVGGLPFSGKQAVASSCERQTGALIRTISVMAWRKPVATAFLHFLSGLRMAWSFQIAEPNNKPRGNCPILQEEYQELRHGRLANVGLLFLRRLEVQPPGERPPALTPSR